jgi:hypothetical protein
MTSETPAQSWFEMTELRRRMFAAAVWVPLRAAETLFETGKMSRPGWTEEMFVANAVAFAPDKRSQAEALDWHHLGISHSGGPYAYRDGRYKPCEVYQYNDHEDLGVDLVFDQHFGNGHQRIWHLSQDLVMALQLLQEEDQWVRPEEDYAVVVRQRRDTDGRVVAIEIRSDCLRDYLAARGLALRLSYYRSRTAVIGDASHFTWSQDGISEELPHDRFQARVWEVDETGGPYGAGVAVFKMWRTDVDPEEDVPVFGQESDSNTDGTSNQFTRAGRKYFRAQGELWRAEWIEPAERSERVRGDKPAEQLSFVVDATGERWASSKLNKDDVGRYLWFDPRVVASLIQKRGGGLIWHSQDTGEVWSLPDYKVHFGVNRVGLITVYAYDIARLPIWQQRTWVAFNVAPDGAVSGELLDAQMRTQPANTSAPETVLPELMDSLDELFRTWIGAPLFKSHEATLPILKTVHRFRASDQSGLLSLAKDLARLIADRIDIGALRTVSSPKEGETWASLKSLEKALATILPADQARSLLTPLVGVYELRLGDAHLPSSTIDAAFAMIRIDRSKSPVAQGFQILARTAAALSAIGASVSEALARTESSSDRNGG